MPELVRIGHEPEYRTATIGRYSDGQFYAMVNGARRDDDRGRATREGIRWYVYLHLFDAVGHHRSSDISLLGVAEYLRGELGRQADLRLTALLDRLSQRTFCDITIRPFEVRYDGVTFGLVDESDDERGDWAELYPEGLGFGEPWDGTYST
nr:hypothetical protein [uncultured bacterium]